MAPFSIHCIYISVHPIKKKNSDGANYCRIQKNFPQPSQDPWLSLKIELIDILPGEKYINLTYVLHDLGDFIRKSRLEETVKPGYF